MTNNLHYKQFLNIYNIIPSLSLLTISKQIPNNWPFSFEGVANKDNNNISFWIADLKTKAICISSNNNLINKILKLEPGQIIFLSDGIVEKYSKVLGLEITVSSIQTVKEFNDSIKDFNSIKIEENTKHDLNIEDNRYVTLAQRLELQRKSLNNEPKK